MENTSEDTTYIYLDFNERLTSNIFANKMFLRIANLQKSNPLVQINDLLFTGSYDECVGTNLFFEEIENPPLKANIFEKTTPIRLKPVISQTKIMKLKQVKLPRQTTSSNKQFKESVTLNLNQDYHTVLEKLEQGVLNIEDLAQKEAEPRKDQEFENITFEELDDNTTEPETEIETLLYGLRDNSPNAILEAKYEKLKRLTRRPVKRMKSPELVEECDPHYKNSYEYHNLEKQVCQNSDAFRSLSQPIIESSFVGGVDIDRCVLQGLIPASSDLNRILTKEEQRKIFTIDNFENLSLPARYIILKECVSQIEELIENTSNEELKEKDENGYTITDICDIFRRLCRALEQTMSQNEVEDTITISKTDLSKKAEDDFVKYKYNPENEIFIPSKEIFNSDEWITKGDGKNNQDEEDSDDSADIDDILMEEAEDN